MRTWFKLLQRMQYIKTSDFFSTRDFHNLEISLPYFPLTIKLFHETDEAIKEWIINSTINYNNVKMLLEKLKQFFTECKKWKFRVSLKELGALHRTKEMKRSNYRHREIPTRPSNTEKKTKAPLHASSLREFSIRASLRQIPGVAHKTNEKGKI